MTTPTPAGLTRAAAVATIAAGALFAGVQIGHPHLDPTTIGSTEVMVRSSLKVLMCALALAGFTGMYLSQIRRNGFLGLVGYAVISTGYLLVLATTAASAYVLPHVAASDPAFVEDFIAAATGGSLSGDLGALGVVLKVQGIAYLGGGLLFGIALFRARVLARWATVLLAAGGLVSALLSVMPDAFYRLLAFPNAIAMIGLGLSLWASTRMVAAEPQIAESTHAAGAR